MIFLRVKMAVYNSNLERVNIKFYPNLLVGADPIYSNIISLINRNLFQFYSKFKF